MAHSDVVIALVLCSACAHAGWNTVVKAGRSRLHALASVDGTAFIICLVALPFIAPLPANVWKYVFISVVLNTIYRLFLIKAYETGDFGQAYPIVRGVPPVLVALLSVVLLGQHLSARAVLGIALVSAGIASLAFTRKATAAMLTPVAMAVLAGSFVAAYTIVDAKGARASDTALQFIVYLTVVQSIPIPLLAVASDRTGFVWQLKNYWVAGGVGGLSYLASYGIVLYAFTVLEAAKVAAIRETSVVIAAVIAAVFFREGFGARRLASAVVIMAGLAFIKLST
jgi:drug/metabolite transporter (DMT)-like permease